MPLYSRLRKSADQLESGYGIAGLPDLVESVDLEIFPAEDVIRLTFDDNSRTQVDYIIKPDMAEKLLAALTEWKRERGKKTN